jgi:hypothetical protein
VIRRLRPLPPPDALRRMYPEPHDHRRFGRGHAERVAATIALGSTIPLAERRSVADLSCGNGVIARALVTLAGELHLGDLACGERGQLVGPIEGTIEAIPNVALFVCSETIEHLDDPLQVLTAIRAKAHRLLLSTPLGCWDDDNIEHLWAWSREGVEGMLADAGWEVGAFDFLDTRTYGEPYLYGMWVAS